MKGWIKGKMNEWKGRMNGRKNDIMKNVDWKLI